MDIKVDYRELIKSSTYHLIDASSGNALNLYNPADLKSIGKVEALIGRKIPTDLYDFYLQSNGASDEWFCFNIMGIEELLKQNEIIRTNSPNITDMLLFSHLDGDMYFYSITDAGYGEIYKWGVILNERTWVADSLENWIKAKNA
jgi:hypothetical protein